MSESVREVEVSGENLSKSLSEKGNMWRRKGREGGHAKNWFFRDTPPRV